MSTRANAAGKHVVSQNVAGARSRLGIVGLVVLVVAAGGWLLFRQISAASVRNESARLAAVLGLREGVRVADVGAGSGAYSLEFARLVGPTGRVFATEIDSKQRR